MKVNVEPLRGAAIPRPDLAAVLTAVLFGWAGGLILGQVTAPLHATRTTEAQAVEIQRQQMQLEQERAASCSMARSLVQQHEIVRNVWPQAPKPVAIVERCDQDRVGQPIPVAFTWRHP